MFLPASTRTPPDRKGERSGQVLACFATCYTLDRSPLASLESIRLSVPGSPSTTLSHPYLQNIEIISCGLEG